MKLAVVCLRMLGGFGQPCWGEESWDVCGLGNWLSEVKGGYGVA